MTIFIFKNLRQLFDNYAVARTEQKYDEDFFQILWPSQKTQTLLRFLHVTFLAVKVKSKLKFVDDANDQ